MTDKPTEVPPSEKKEEVKTSPAPVAQPTPVNPPTEKKEEPTVVPAPEAPKKESVEVKKEEPKPVSENVPKTEAPATEVQPVKKDAEKAEKAEKKKEDEVDIEFKKIVSHFPEEIKKKFVAMKYIADKREALEDQMSKEIEALEKQFDALFAPVDAARDEIINGKRDPLPEELAKSAEYEKAQPVDQMPEGIDFNAMKTIKGVPEFWLKAMQHCKLIKEHIYEQDIPILKHLTNIKHVKLEGDVFFYNITLKRMKVSFLNSRQMTILPILYLQRLS